MLINENIQSKNGFNELSFPRIASFGVLLNLAGTKTDMHLLHLTLKQAILQIKENVEIFN
jgi:hypothetical protein